MHSNQQLEESESTSSHIGIKKNSKKNNKTKKNKKNSKTTKTIKRTNEIEETEYILEDLISDNIEKNVIRKKIISEQQIQADISDDMESNNIGPSNIESNNINNIESDKENNTFQLTNN